MAKSSGEDRNIIRLLQATIFSFHVAMITINFYEPKMTKIDCASQALPFSHLSCLLSIPLLQISCSLKDSLPEETQQNMQRSSHLPPSQPTNITVTAMKIEITPNNNFLPQAAKFSLYGAELDPGSGVSYDPVYGVAGDSLLPAIDS